MSCPCAGSRRRWARSGAGTAGRSSICRSRFRRPARASRLRVMPRSTPSTARTSAAAPKPPVRMGKYLPDAARLDQRAVAHAGIASSPKASRQAAWCRARAGAARAAPARTAPGGSGQRGAKRQPGGMLTDVGHRPPIVASRSRRAAMSGIDRAAAACIRMRRRIEDRPRRRGLRDAPGVQHRHAIGDFRDHAEIVGDQHHRHAGFALQIAQQLQDLRLDR